MWNISVMSSVYMSLLYFIFHFRKVIFKKKKKKNIFLSSPWKQEPYQVNKELIDIVIIQLKLKCYYKFIHEKLARYLQNLALYANINTHNYVTQTNQNVHLEFIPNHEYAKMCVRYQVPNIAIYIIEQNS